MGGSSSAQASRDPSPTPSGHSYVSQSYRHNTTHTHTASSQGHGHAHNLSIDPILLNGNGTLAPPPAAPHGPRSPAVGVGAGIPGLGVGLGHSRTPSPTPRGVDVDSELYQVQQSYQQQPNDLGSGTIRVAPDFERESDDEEGHHRAWEVVDEPADDEGGGKTPIKPSAKALGKRKVIEETLDREAFLLILLTVSQTFMLQHHSIQMTCFMNTPTTLRFRSITTDRTTLIRRIQMLTIREVGLTHATSPLTFTMQPQKGRRNCYARRVWGWVLMVCIDVSGRDSHMCEIVIN